MFFVLTGDFINLWKGERCLWDVISPLYGDTDARNKTLKGFAAHFSMTGKISTVCTFVLCTFVNIMQI